MNQIKVFVNIRNFSIIGVQLLLVLLLDYGFRLLNVIIINTRIIAGAVVQMVSITCPSGMKSVCVFFLILDDSNYYV